MQNLLSYNISATYNTQPPETYFPLPITKSFLITSCNNIDNSLTCKKGNISF